MKKKVLLIIALFSLVILSSGHSISHRQFLKIPSQAEILTNGYPINQYGETYGPDVKDAAMVPDLILAQNEENLFGYVKATDLSDGVETLADALSASHIETSPRCIPMYLQDGHTIIGTYMTGG